MESSFLEFDELGDFVSCDAANCPHAVVLLRFGRTEEIERKNYKSIGEREELKTLQPTPVINLKVMKYFKIVLNNFLS